MEVTKWDIGAALELLENTPDELLENTLGEAGDTIQRRSHISPNILQVVSPVMSSRKPQGQTWPETLA